MLISESSASRWLWLVIAFLLTLSAECISQTVPAGYQIATWQGFRSAAISYTFDDNCPNQLAIAVPLFDKFGFKVTLFTVTSPDWAWPANWAGLQKAALYGNEIASHTIDHPKFDTLSDSALRAELSRSQDTINAHIKGQKCIAIAYPYCVPGNEAIDAEYYIAARGCSGQIANKTPDDFMNISSFVCGDKGLNTVAAIEAEADSAAAQHGWCVYLMHGINGTEPGAYSPISQDTILATLEYLSANPDKFWVAPFGTVARYIKERNSASVSEVSAHGDSITFRLSDNLDSSYYDVPLTVHRELPKGWNSAGVYRNGDTVSSSIVKIDTVRYVVFDAAPDTGNITIAKGQPKFLGNVIGTYTPSDFAKYWDQVTPENAGKWGNVGVNQDPKLWSWSHLDSIYDYAVRKGFPFKFHNLVWGPQQPTWIAGLPPAKQKKMVETWISEAGRRYPKAAMVDVVNEPIQKPPVYKNAIGGNGSTGWDWVIWSFMRARKAFPHSKLLVNEYNILRSREMTEKYIGVIDLLKKRHLLDGIGCQGHFMENVSPDTIASNLRLLAATGLPIYISEYDVNEANDSRQLAIYKKQFPIFWTNPDVKGVTLWGYIQGIIWRTDAYLVRSDGTERPALKWLSRYVTSTYIGSQEDRRR